MRPKCTYQDCQNSRLVNDDSWCYIHKPIATEGSQCTGTGCKSTVIYDYKYEGHRSICRQCYDWSEDRNRIYNKIKLDSLIEIGYMEFTGSVFYARFIMFYRLYKFKQSNKYDESKDAFITYCREKQPPIDTLIAAIEINDVLKKRERTALLEIVEKSKVKK